MMTYLLGRLDRGIVVKARTSKARRELVGLREIVDDQIDFEPERLDPEHWFVDRIQDHLAETTSAYHNEKLVEFICALARRHGRPPISADAIVKRRDERKEERRLLAQKLKDIFISQVASVPIVGKGPKPGRRRSPRRRPPRAKSARR